MSVAETYVVEIGGFGPRETAEMVIAALSRLSGQAYRLEDIRLQNVSPPGPQRISDQPMRKHRVVRQGS